MGSSDNIEELLGRFEIYNLEFKMKQNSGCIFDFFSLMNFNCLI